LKIIIANITFLLVLTCGNYSSFAQQLDSIKIRNYNSNRLFKTYKKSEILTGVSWQGNVKEDEYIRYLEIGLARSIHYYGMHGPASIGVFAAEEIYIGDSNIYGTKIGAYIHYLFDFGLSMIYYTDFKKGNFKVRPEFGVGMGLIRIVIGYNFPTIDNKAFDELRKNNGQVTIQLLIPAKKRIIKGDKSIFESLLNK